MDDKLLSGIVVGALTGLTYLAYKHPEAYQKRIYWMIVGPLFLFMIAATIWSAGVLSAYAVLISLIVPDKLGAAHEAIEILKPWPATWTHGVILVILVSYLGFLGALPHILNIGTTTKRKRKPRTRARNQ